MADPSFCGRDGAIWETLFAYGWGTNPVVAQGCKCFKFSPNSASKRDSEKRFDTQDKNPEIDNLLNFPKILYNSGIQKRDLISKTKIQKQILNIELAESIYQKKGCWMF